MSRDHSTSSRDRNTQQLVPRLDVIFHFTAVSFVVALYNKQCALGQYMIRASAHGRLV